MATAGRRPVSVKRTEKRRQVFIYLIVLLVFAALLIIFGASTQTARFFAPGTQPIVPAGVCEGTHIGCSEFDNNAEACSGHGCTFTPVSEFCSGDHVPCSGLPSEVCESRGCSLSAEMPPPDGGIGVAGAQPANCAGTPKSCSEYADAEACNAGAEYGCSWNSPITTAAASSGSGSCTGAPHSCSSFADEESCTPETQFGCLWRPDTLPPSVSSVSPESAVVGQGTAFASQVSDDFGIQSCDFFYNNQNFGTATIVPSLMPPSPGQVLAGANFEFTPAVAGDSIPVLFACRDGAGNEGAGQTTFVKVTSAPIACTVTLSIPSTVNVSQSVEAIGAASPVGCTAQIRMLAPNGSVMLDADSQGKASKTWTPPTDFSSAVGSYNFSACIPNTDCLGINGETKVLAVVSAPPPQDTTAPLVLAAHSPASPEANQTVTYAYNATDEASIKNLTLILDGIARLPNCLGTNKTIACSFSENYSTAGAHNYFAVAYDNAGNFAREPPTGAKAFNVTAPSAPDKMPPKVIGSFSFTSTATAANITWQTDEPANYSLGYTNISTKPSFIGLVFSSNFLLRHNAFVSGLRPNATYYYNITLCDVRANCVTIDPEFTTKPQNVTGPRCGNNRCEAPSETQINCPVDCGCPAGFTLVGVGCQPTPTPAPAPAPALPPAAPEVTFAVGDGICGTALGETQQNSPGDCAAQVNFLLIGVLAAIIIAVVAGASYFFYRRGRPSAGAEVAGMKPYAGKSLYRDIESQDKLSGYVQRMKAKGYDNDSIRRSLEEAGWPDSTINSVLK